MTTANRERRMLTIAGFSLSAWAFALRTWAAMMTALYAAFWLQLDSASSAAATVGILAQQTRGQAYQRAMYRILATVVGVVASFVIAGLAPQNRELFTIGVAAWLGLCVYVAGLLDGGRAYAAVLSGYTVALVAVTQIDSPQNVFLTGVNRGAAIVVGVAALALVSDILGAPSLHSSLATRFAAAHQRIRVFAVAVLEQESAEPIQSANLLREITELRPDIEALVVESSRGLARRAAARSAAVALVSEVSAVRALAFLSGTTSLSLRREVENAFSDHDLEEENCVLQLRLQHAEADHADPHSALFARFALELLVQDRKAKDAIEALQAGRFLSHRIDAPIYRSRQAAVRNGLRAFLVVLISTALFSLGGWPSASQGVVLVAVIIALSANATNPGGFATAAVIAMAIAVLLAGVTEFLILDGVNQFPLLAIGMAPSVLAAALLCTTSNPRLALIAFLVLVFFPVMLSPENPQQYNPELYLSSSFIATVAVMLLFVLLRTVLPTSDAIRRCWYLTSARAEMRALLDGGCARRRDAEALFLDADRIAQLAALQPAAGDERRDDLRLALDIFGYAAAVRQVWTARASLSARVGEQLFGDACSALAACDPRGLRQAAADLARATPVLGGGDRTVLRAASLDLIWLAFLIDSNAMNLESHGSTNS